MTTSELVQNFRKNHHELIYYISALTDGQFAYSDEENGLLVSSLVIFTCV